MTASPRQSPLSALRHHLDEVEAATSGRIRLAEVPYLTMLAVHLDSGDEDLLRRLHASIDLDWPTTANRASMDADALVLWLGPDEWLVVSATNPADRLGEQLLDAAGESWVTVTDVSAQRTVIALSGPASRDVLITGCALDLDLDRFPVGHCAHTMLARAGISLLATTDECFWIFVRSSFAEYLATWLLDATSEVRAADP